MKYLSIMLILTLIYTKTLSAQDQQDPQPNWCVSVWYPSSEDPTGYDSIRDNLAMIDTVNPFWYGPMADGAILSRPDAEDAAKLTFWRDAGIIVMPAIFGNMWTMIDDPESRTHHVEQIVGLVERMDYDGIDIDYEGFDPSTRENFSLFIEELAAELHAHGRLLSIAVHAKTNDQGSWDGPAAQDWERLGSAVDVFRIMTYDYTSRNEPPGPIGPPSWSADVLVYAESVVDLGKVRLGLHFYGYSWQRGTPPATAVTWQSVNRWIESFQLDVMRDAEDMEATVELDIRGLPKQTIYFADAEAIEYKLDRLITEFPDLGGVAIWGLGGEDPMNWDVLEVVSQGDCVIGMEKTYELP